MNLHRLQLNEWRRKLKFWNACAIWPPLSSYSGLSCPNCWWMDTYPNLVIHVTNEQLIQWREKKTSRSLKTCWMTTELNDKFPESLGWGKLGPKRSQIDCTNRPVWPWKKIRKSRMLYRGKLLNWDTFPNHVKAKAVTTALVMYYW